MVVTVGLSSITGTITTGDVIFREDEPDDGEPATIAFISPPSGSIGPMSGFKRSLAYLNESL